MGQQQSREFGDHRQKLRGGRRSRRNLKNRISSFRSASGRFSVHGDDDDSHLEEKIKLYRKELERLTAHGKEKQREHRIELSRMDNELYRKRVDLHQLGERAKTYFTFWDYVKIVQRATPTFWSPDTMTFVESESEASESGQATDDVAKSPGRSKSPRSRMKKSQSPRTGRKKSLGTPNGSSRKRRPISGKEEKKRMLITRSSTDMTFTIFGFFEAYLLRRLHLALLLKNQSHMQRHRWNDIIVYCYDEIPATKRDTQQAKEWLEYLKSVTPDYQKRLEETYEQILALQDKMMYRLRSQGINQQAAFRTIEEAIQDSYRAERSFPTISQTSSGEIDFEEQDETTATSFSYGTSTEVAAAPADPEESASLPTDGRIYAASEFHSGRKASIGLSTHSLVTAESSHSQVLERKESSDWSSDTSLNSDLGDEKEMKIVRKEDEVTIEESNEQNKGKRGSKWKLPWRAPLSSPEGEGLKISADNSAIGNEYGRLSMRDDDDVDDDRYDFISQEANQQPMASSALAGPASMMLLQKSIRAQQKESKGESQQHFQLNTTGSDDA